MRVQYMCVCVYVARLGPGRGDEYVDGGEQEEEEEDYEDKSGRPNR